MGAESTSGRDFTFKGSEQHWDPCLSGHVHTMRQFIRHFTKILKAQKKNNIPILSEIELKGKYKTQEVARVKIRMNFWFQVLTLEKIYLDTTMNYLHDRNDPKCPDPQVSNSNGHYVRYLKSVTLAIWK